MQALDRTEVSPVPRLPGRGDAARRRLSLGAVVVVLTTGFVLPVAAQASPRPAAGRHYSLLPAAPPRRGLGLGLAPVAADDDGPSADIELLPPEPRDIALGAGPVAFGHRVAADLHDLVLRTPRHLDAGDWRLLATGAVAIEIAHLADDDARATVLRHGGGASGRSWAHSIRPLGQEGGLVLASLAWASGEYTGHEEISAAAQDSLEATVIAAGVIAPLLKATVGRSRPRTGDGSASFPGGAESFPSGEVTQAFAMASVIAAHSHRRWVDGLAWAGASAIAWERMRLDAHWLSDVTAGALIGAGIGRWIVRRNHPEVLVERDGWNRLGARWQMQPVAGQHRVGLAVRVTF